MTSAWKAVARIYYPNVYNGVLAYNVGDIVPAANVTAYGYDSLGLVALVTVSDPAAALPGVDAATQGELDALGGRMARPGVGYAVAIGDSITAWNGDGNPLRQRETWFQRLCAQSNQRIRYGAVYATGGYTLSQIRDVHLPPVIAMTPKPSACFVFGGTNLEVGGLAAGFPVLIQICDALVAAGIVPIPVALLERGGIAPNPANHQNWNVALRRFCADRGYLILEMGPSLLTTTTAIQNSALYEVDLTHPLFPTGHVAMATRAITTDLFHLHFPKRVVTSKVALAADNILPFSSGLFLTDGNADGLADNLSAAGTNVTYSLVTPAGGDDLSGKWQRVTRTTGGATSTVWQRSASLANGFAVGDRVAFSGRFRATVAGTGSTYTYQANWTGAPGSPHSLEPVYNWERDCDGTFYGEAIVPAGTTSINCQCALSVPTSGVPVLDTGEFTLTNLTTGTVLLP